MIELFLENSILLEGFYKNLHASQKGESVPGRDVKVSQGYLKDEFLDGLRASQPFGKGKQKLEFLSLQPSCLKYFTVLTRMSRKMTCDRVTALSSTDGNMEVRNGSVQR